jgi:GT2 family glycosyltransferase
MTTLSIIILSFNTKDLVAECITSLVRWYKQQLDTKEFEIILVDNNSSDGTLDTLKKAPFFKYIKLIENKENAGFSKGSNIGVSHAKGKYILFLNSDTTVEDAGINNMVSFMEKHSDVGICGGRLKNNDGSYQSSAGVFYSIPNVLLLLIGGERLGKLRFSPEKETSVDWVSGAMMMTEKSFFEKIGMFDDHIFMYVEDMELCFRVKKEGKQVVFYPSCTVSHLSHGSSNRSFAIVQIYKGIVYFYKKHRNYVSYLLVKGLLYTKAYILVIIGTLIGNTYLKKTYSQAIASL